MKIVADDKIPFIQQILSNYAEVVYIPAHQICRQHLQNCDALLVRTRTQCNEELLSGTSIKFIGTATIGTDHIDLAYCLQNGIQVANAPGCNSNSVNQYVASALAYYSLQKNIPLHRLTLGVIGHGNVGSKVTNTAKSLKMQVLVNDPPLSQTGLHANFQSIDELLQNSDILTLHVPLSEFGQYPTLRFFDKSFFNKIKKAKLLINTSRGEVIAEDALLDYKTANPDFDYIIDVMANEPRVSKELLSSAMLATPHIAGYSADGKANGSASILKSLFQYFKIPFTDWYPEAIHTNQPIILNIDNTALSAETTAKTAILQTYNIQKDNDLLRQDLKAFETIRNNYPQRLESHHYLVNLTRECTETLIMLEDLGFKTNISSAQKSVI